MRHLVSAVLCATALLAGAAVATAQGPLLPPAQPPPAQPPPAPPAPAPPQPAPVPPSAQAPNPCGDRTLRCPDLVIARPSRLRTFRTLSGRVRLGSRNRLINLGAGPLSLHGRRATARTMTVAQRVYRRGSGSRMFALRGVRFDFWFIPGQGRYWKLRDALRFELWTAGSGKPRRVRTGRKTRFCMRDLLKAPGRSGPRRRVFPGCSQNSRARTVRMGISRGWVESYPTGYHEQYVDVTGLRGCFTLRHVADPRGHVLESREANNVARTVVRLPLGRGGRVGRC